MSMAVFNVNTPQGSDFDCGDHEDSLSGANKAFDEAAEGGLGDFIFHGWKENLSTDGSLDGTTYYKGVALLESFEKGCPVEPEVFEFIEFEVSLMSKNRDKSNDQ